MKHARNDYNRMQDPLGLIGEDEPVCLFRAKDRFFIGVLEAYRAMLTDFELAPAPGMIESIDAHIALTNKWYETHAPKTPDLPEGEFCPKCGNKEGHSYTSGGVCNCSRCGTSWKVTHHGFEGGCANGRTMIASGLDQSKNPQRVTADTYDGLAIAVIADPRAVRPVLPPSEPCTPP